MKYIKLDRQIFKLDKARLNSGKVDTECESVFDLERQLDVRGETTEMRNEDPDNLVTLVKEVIPNESCLIFCQSKKNCESVALLLARFLPAELKYHKRDLKLKLFSELKEENMNNICPTLRQSIPYGIAYHHSGLTSEERQLIEQAYRDGVLCLITCTSTLAAGVNLPAKRVIIRAPYVATEFLTTNQYKQMIGRAGRAGLIDSTGESILVFKNQDKQKVLDLITGPMKRCESSFQCDDCKAIRILVLSLIGLKMTHYGSQVLLFFNETLFFLQQKAKLSKREATDEKDETEDEAAVEDEQMSADKKKLIDLVPEEFRLISKALEYLIEMKFIQLVPNEYESILKSLKEVTGKYLYYATFEITKMGLATIRGNIDMDYVHQLYSDLNAGLKTMVLSNYLHLIYLCTPYDMVNSLSKIDLDIYALKVS
jgi:POLQ-like helicase